MGILDAGFDPRTQGLLAAAFQGLQASGPSRMPMSLGQIIGQAGSAGMGQFNAAQKAALEQARQQQLMELEKQRAEADRLKAEQEAKKQAGIDAFQQKFSSGAFTTSPAQQALANGAGPTPANAGLIPNLSPKLDLGAMYQEMIGTPGLLSPGVTGLASMEENAAKREETRALLEIKINEAREARDQKSVDALERLKLQLDSKQSLAEMMMAGRKDIAQLAGSMRQPQTAYSNIQPDNKGGFIGLSKATGRMEQVPMADGVDKKPLEKPISEVQGKSFLYQSRAAQAAKVIDEMEGKYSPAEIATKQGLGKVWGVGGVLEAGANVLMPKNTQKVEQAQRNFVNAVLRQESGAAIAESEFANAQKQYFPQPGDAAPVLAQKRQNRQAAIEGLQVMAGPAMKRRASDKPGAVVDFSELPQ